MPARRAHARRLQSRRAGADDNDAFFNRGRGDLVRHRFFAPGGGVVNAQRFAVFVNAVEAVAGADARADSLLFAALDFDDNHRIGDVRARHSNHIDLAFAHGVARRRRVDHARGMKHRLRDDALNRRRAFEMRRERAAQIGNHPRQMIIVMQRAAIDIEKIDQAARRQFARNRRAVRRAQPAGAVFVADHARADNAIVADRLAHRAQNLERKAQAVLRSAIVFVVAAVGQRRPKRIEQMPRKQNLDSVQPARSTARGGGGEIARDAAQIPTLDLFGKRSMRRLAQRRRGDEREPIAARRRPAPPQMRELADDFRAAIVDAVGEFREPLDNLVAEGLQVAESGRRIRRHHGRAADHRERNPARRFLLVIQAVAFFRQSVLGIKRLVGGAHHAVFQPQVADLQRPQQRIVGALHRRLAVTPRPMRAAGGERKRAQSIRASTNKRA